MGERKLDLEMTVAEYLAFEERSEFRNEYFDGQIFPLDYRTPLHGLIGANAITEIGLASREKDWLCFNESLRIRIETTHSFLYPTLSVTYQPQTLRHPETESLLNPIFVLEVLSEKTEPFRHREKIECYKQVPTLQAYCRISPDQPLVEVFSRKDENIWEMRAYSKLEESISLKALEAEISIAEIYRGVEGVN